MKTYHLHFTYATKATKIDGRFCESGTSSTEIEADSAPEAVSKLFNLPIDRHDAKSKLGKLADIWNIRVFEEVETPSGGW